MKQKVFVTRELPGKALDIIREEFEVEVWNSYAPPSKEIIKAKSREANALITLLSDKIDAEIFDVAPKLEIVAQMAVGFDNIDVQEATKRGICVTNTPEVLTDTTADFAWALLMAIARRVVEADRYVREGKWQVGWHPTLMTGRDIYGKTLGIVGAGRIGCAVAQRAKGFGMKILYCDDISRPDIENRLGARRVSIEQLLHDSDFITIHVPLTKGTYHLINKENLSLMKESAYIINNSRGPVIDEKALFDALSTGKIAGAGLDVFEKEPIPKDSPLLRLQNVVVAPHISSASIETRSRMAMMVAENLIAYFKGEKIPNLVNPKALTVHNQIKAENPK